MFEFIATAVICYFFGSWLMGKLAKRPDAAFRGASVGCGLFLVVSMTVRGIVMGNTPGLQNGFIVHFFLWAVLDVVLMARAVRGR